MRITHQQLSRNYLKRMNNNLTNLTKSNERMTSERAYNKGYENVTDAGKALRVRKLLANSERYLTNIRDASGRATAAEDCIRSVNSILNKATDLVTEGLNGTFNQDDRDKIATEIKALQDEVFKTMNSSFGDKYLFTASGNKDGSAPFSVVSGELMYNGTAVDSMTRGTSGQILDATSAPIQYNEPNYVDIGFGYKVTGNKVDPNTAFRDTFSGVESFGFGLNSDGMPVNAYSLLGDMVTNLNNGNRDALAKDLDGIKVSMNALLTSVTEIGARVTTLENTASRLEDEYINLAETQKKLEGLDLSEEIIYNKDFETSWLVTLQLGSKILPQTIFDFIR